jgi:formate dehydrogenase (NADP+) alpha subunit
MPETKLTIDNKEVEVEAGTTILEAARQLGIDIPTFCYDPELPPNGACRICVVEVEKARALIASCVTPVAPGMVVYTESERVVRARKEILSLMVANHPLVCITCEKTGECKLQDYCYRYGVSDSAYVGEIKELSADDSNEFFIRDMNKCILCGICVGKCQDVVGAGAIDFTKRGFISNVGPAYEDRIEDSTCVFCGLCIDSCPVGALTPKFGVGKGRSWELETTRAICPYCSVGCGLDLHSKDGVITGVTAAAESPVNRGHLCARGKFGWDYQQSSERITTPLIKSNGVFVEVSWEEALGYIADNLNDLRNRYGASSLMGLCSPKLTNEESYLFQKLIRSLGSNNIDSYTRHCHASSVDAMMEVLGGAAMTNSIEELVSAKSILVIEADPLDSHPIIGYRVREAVRKGAKLIVANDEQVGLSDIANHYLPLKAGSAIALVNAMAKVILTEELHDEAFVAKRTEGFDVFVKGLDAFSPEVAAEITGISAEEIRAAARAYARAETAAIISSAVIRAESGGDLLVQALVNLALLTGNFGKESCGLYLPYSENNLQGCADMGALPGVLTGYQSVKEKSVRDKFTGAWKTPISAEPGISATELFEQGKASGIRGMFILAENPAACGEESFLAISVLENLDFLVVQDIFMTETAALADVILPAIAFAEKLGTYTNTERRVQLNQPAVEPPGTAFPDWAVIAELAVWFGFDWAYDNPEDVFEEMAALTPQYAGISYERLLDGGLQWPCPSDDHPGTGYLYTGRFGRGLGLFSSIDFKPNQQTGSSTLPQQKQIVEHGCHCISDSMRKHSVISSLRKVSAQQIDSF